MVKKVLVVDDDPQDLKMIESILAKSGYEVELAENGADAIDMLKKSKFDLVTIDILMPTFSGYDLLRLLRDGHNKFPIMYITIVPQKDVVVNKVDGYIHKPFSPESLLKEVKRVLKGFPKRK